jgi:hypothetical protein
VFNAVVSVAVGYEPGQLIPYLLELVPLASKTAQNLATALEVQLQEILSNVPGGTSTPRELQVTHVIVGDGVPSNEKAARMLLHRHAVAPRARPGADEDEVQGQAHGLPLVTPCTDYRCVFLKCASHTVNLVMTTAVGTSNGLASTEVHAEYDPNKTPSLVATLSRLCKHVLVEAGELLQSRLRKMLLRDMVVQLNAPEETTRLAGQAMQLLYGRLAVPDSMLRSRPYGLQHPHTLTQPGRSQEEEQLTVMELIRKLLLQPEERPVITRFWRFGSCAMQLCRYVLLGIDTEELFASTTSQQKEGHHRMGAIAAFFKDPGTPQQLREVALAARLVLRAQGVASRRSGPGDLPNIVSLVKGDVQEQTSLLLTEMLLQILAGADPMLQVQSAVLHLIKTYITLVWRFDSYSEYPFRLALLVKSWNPVYYAREAIRFLQADADKVDVGWGLPLRQAALRTSPGWEVQGHAGLQPAVDYLLSEPVQCELKAVCTAVLTTSLDVERAHNVVKQASERLSGIPMSVALASRTHILQQYHIWRRGKMQERRKTATAMNKLRCMNSQALSVREHSAILPKGTGQLHWEPSCPQCSSIRIL